MWHTALGTKGAKVTKTQPSFQDPTGAQSQCHDGQLTISSKAFSLSCEGSKSSVSFAKRELNSFTSET